MIMIQNVGIDGGSKEFKVCLMTMDQNQVTKVKGSRKFVNTLEGFKAFVEWINKKKADQVPLRFTMEATGVYYEQLAYFLDDQDYYVSVLLPNRAKAYFKNAEFKK